MLSKFLAVIIVSTFGVAVFESASFAASVFTASHEDVSLDGDKHLTKTSAVEDVPPSIKLPRNDGSADLTYFPPNSSLTREVSDGWGHYDSLSPVGSRNDSKDNFQDHFLEALLIVASAHKREKGSVLISFESPSQSTRKKLPLSVKDEEKTACSDEKIRDSVSNQIVYHGITITFVSNL